MSSTINELTCVARLLLETFKSEYFLHPMELHVGKHGAIAVSKILLITTAQKLHVKHNSYGNTVPMEQLLKHIISRLLQRLSI